MQPVRIQRRRTKGFNLLEVSRAANGLDCICVTRPGRWGNPFDVSRYGRDLSLAVFRNTAQGIWSPDPLVDQPDDVCNAMYAEHHGWLKRLGGHPLELIDSELRGRNLACYCALSEACHGDILLTLAHSND